MIRISCKRALRVILHVFFGEMICNFQTNDLLEMKKKHPCGCSRFRVIFAGSDVKVRCETCGREMIIPRIKLEKNIKRVLSENDD